MSPTLHTALEPMAFCGLLQDKEREVLHSGPGGGTYHLYEEEFKRCWVSTKVDGQDTGTALLLEPGPEFYGMEDEGETGNVTSDSFSDIYRPTGGRWHSSCWAW